MYSCYVSVLMLLAGFPTGLPDNQSLPIVVTIGAQARRYKSIDSASLKVSISNKSGQPLIVQTITGTPPVFLDGMYEDGQPAIVNVALPKNRTTKNVDYELAPFETKSYEVSIPALMRETGRLVGPGTGEIKLHVALPVVKYEGGSYKVDQIESNEVQITIPAK